MSEIISEFKGKGLMNRLALKYCAWLFLAMFILAGNYVWLHGEDRDDILADHQVQHDVNDVTVKNALDGLLAQINTNFATSEVMRRIDRKEAQLGRTKENLAMMKRVIERGDDVPEIYYKDRDRYEIELADLETDITGLKQTLQNDN